jgi:hypothetical protein
MEAWLQHTTRELKDAENTLHAKEHTHHLVIIILVILVLLGGTTVSATRISKVYLGSKDM